MKKAALHNLGCKVNAYETEAMQEILEKSGYEIVSFHDKADVYVINTCTVTNMADRKSRQMIHRARKMNPDAVIVAAGCYVQARGDELEEGIDIVIGNNKKQELAGILEHYWQEREKRGRQTAVQKRNVDIGHTSEYEELHLTHTGETYPRIYQSTGWMQSVLLLLYYSLCKRKGEKPEKRRCGSGSKRAGKRRI